MGSMPRLPIRSKSVRASFDDAPPTLKSMTCGCRLAAFVNASTGVKSYAPLSVVTPMNILPSGGKCSGFLGDGEALGLVVAAPVEPTRRTDVVHGAMANA